MLFMNKITEEQLYNVLPLWVVLPKNGEDFVLPFWVEKLRKVEFELFTRPFFAMPEHDFVHRVL
jgi:hypothetical protein